MSNRETRHILSLSGGKDSAALAIFMKDRIPSMEYVFCDTEKELPETYSYLSRIEAILGKPITTLKHDGRGFDHWLTIFNNYLPSQRMRWCTRHLKLHPFEIYVREDEVINYVGIRADEDREGYVSTKPNITAKFPFKEEGISYPDVERILIESGIGLPPYRHWRSRSGCYFCFFQQKIEWVGLYENHRDLFEKASEYEKIDEKTGKRFTWNGNESLKELARPERIAEIKAGYQLRLERSVKKSSHLMEILEDNEGPEPCLICTL